MCARSCGSVPSRSVLFFFLQFVDVLWNGINMGIYRMIHHLHLNNRNGMYYKWWDMVIILWKWEMGWYDDRYSVIILYWCSDSYILILISSYCYRESWLRLLYPFIMKIMLSSVFGRTFACRESQTMLWAANLFSAWVFFFLATRILGECKLTTLKYFPHFLHQAELRTS